jgi:hypothetical protein
VYKVTDPRDAGQAGTADTRVQWAWLIRPGADLVGYLAINGTAYQVSEQQFDHDGYADRLWDLRKSDGTTYRLCRDRDQDLTCDCPDATYRGQFLHAPRA